MVSKPNTRKNAKSNSFTYFAKFVKFFFIALMIITMVGSLYVAKYRT
jgi:penicillin-binding protein 1A